MNEWLHDPGNNGRLLLKVEPKDFTVGKTNEKPWEPHWYGKTDALPVHNSKRTTLQQVNIPKCMSNLISNQYQHAYLWSLANPFGATLSSSSIPNIFCRSPSGCGLASPKNLTNSGAAMTDRSRRGFRWILDLDDFKIVEPMTKIGKMILYLMVASSFFWGHQEPAAIILSLPGLTRILILD